MLEFKDNSTRFRYNGTFWKTSLAGTSRARPMNELMTEVCSRILTEIVFCRRKPTLTRKIILTTLRKRGSLVVRALAFSARDHGLENFGVRTCFP